MRLSSKKIGGNVWFLNFIPDSVLQFAILCVLGLGAGLYVLGLFLNFLPPLRPYKELIRILATVLMVAGVYGYGSYANEMSWRAKVREAEEKVKLAEEQSKEVNTVIETKIVKQKQVIHDVQVQLQKEIQVNEKIINAECKLDPIVVKILNNAATNPFNNTGETK